MALGITASSIFQSFIFHRSILHATMFSEKNTVMNRHGHRLTASFSGSMANHKRCARRSDPFALVLKHLLNTAAVAGFLKRLCGLARFYAPDHAGVGCIWIPHGQQDFGGFGEAYELHMKLLSSTSFAANGSRKKAGLSSSESSLSEAIIRIFNSPDASVATSPTWATPLAALVTTISFFAFPCLIPFVP